MAKGLGFSQPQRTSPVNPETQARRRAGVRGTGNMNKYDYRRTPYYNQVQNSLSSMNYGTPGYGSARWRANNDSGPLPSAYLNYIER